LAAFLAPKKPASPLEQELGYLLLLVVGAVDEGVGLTADKADVGARGWDACCRQLSNAGRVVHALQRYRVLVVV
jgi:hypothetical protein